MLRCLVTIVSLIAATAALAAPALSPEIIHGADGGWDYASVDSASNRLLVARTDGVMMVDLKTGKVTDRFVAGDRVHAAFILPGGKRGIATNGGTDTATLFDAQSGAVIATLPTGKKPDAAVYDPASKAVWVMNHAAGTATVIDPASAKVIDTVTIAAGKAGNGVLEFAVVDGKGRLWVNVENVGGIVEVDTRKRKAVRSIMLNGCEEPSGLALTKAGLLISACANGGARIINAATREPVAAPEIGLNPDAVIYDAKRDRAYIPSSTGELAIIDTAPAIPLRIGTVTTKPGARTGALDPATGKIYLPAADFAPAVGDERRKLLPGSFVVLVVTP